MPDQRTPFVQWLRRIQRRVLGGWKITRYAPRGIDEFAFDGPSVLEDIHRKYDYDGDLLTIYSQHSGHLVHKWHHYIPIYDRYFTPFRGHAPRLLEIGVSKGGSLAIWRKFLGPDATIYGIDIDEDCRQYDGIDGQVRIGSQNDPAFLRSVIAEMGGVDIIIDDGSHRMNDLKASLDALFPLLNNNGIYLIEDLHTAYWTEFGGGLGTASNFFTYVRDIVDDMHHWYHEDDMRHPEIAGSCAAIHIYDSIVVLEKAKQHPPVHSTIS
ncbi:class I SAM-dependent methyltransferase [Roseovarius sp. EGI FJ00037]|uniref:class I SAM-dependent methyltransferase n=1 Tax=Roseovarius salincola TaxID=2978479 RepID=UPI0022A7734B|nr:class I SAM-dependent methyltransferase [Roseovarius sp. EGI FJ00037]MCZ0811209.1 class I SAM-dependent methyltransferase [Roseovarius sp. EGI FJ00037]